MSIDNAVDRLAKVTHEVAIKQAEATERLAVAMEAVAEQQRKQTYLMGVLAINASTDVNVPDRHRDPPRELADEYLKELLDKG